MRDYAELVESLRECSRRNAKICMVCGAKASNLCEGTKAKRMFYAADAIEELLAKVPTWRSASEPPKDNKQVLVVIKSFGHYCVASGFRWNGLSWETETLPSDFRWTRFDDVVLWLPLPAPPKEDAK